MSEFSRRRFFHLAGTLGAVASQGFRLGAQQQYPPPVALTPVFPYAGRSPVGLVKGDVRRKNVFDALAAVDREVRPAMTRKKYVLIKINNVSTTNQLAATHVDAILGILDYVAPRFKGPVVIAEASSRDTLEGFDNFKYAQVIPEFKAQKIKLVDLNREKEFEVFAIVDRNIRPVPVRLASRLMDPDAFVISAAMLKTHNAVVATGSVKNMVLGAPLHSLAGETPVFADKHLYHAMPPGREKIGVNDCHHAMIYNMAITALHMRRNWAQPGAAALLRRDEGAEELVHLVGGDARPVVADLDPHKRCVRPGSRVADLHLPAAARVSAGRVDGVGDHVEHRAVDALRIEDQLGHGLGRLPGAARPAPRWPGPAISSITSPTTPLTLAVVRSGSRSLLKVSMSITRAEILFWFFSTIFQPLPTSDSSCSVSPISIR